MYVCILGLYVAAVVFLLDPKYRHIAVLIGIIVFVIIGVVAVVCFKLDFVGLGDEGGGENSFECHANDSAHM